MPKLIRLTTNPIFFKTSLEGQIDFLQKKGFQIILASSDRRDLLQILRQTACEHVVIPFSEEIFSPIQDLKCFLLLIKLFKKESPAIVHSDSHKAGFLSMLAAKFSGIKVRIHTPSEDSLFLSINKPGFFAQKIRKTTLDSATDVWVNSQAISQIISEQKLCSADKLHLIHQGSVNGVDLLRFNRKSLQENHLVAATMRILPNEDDFIILFVGPLVGTGGINVLVKAFSHFKFQKQAKLVLIGSLDKLEPLDIEIRNAIDENPRIIQVDRSEHLAYYMALSDVLVHPTRGIDFQNVLLKAGAMCLPIICSDGPGNLQLISSAKKGVVFPSGDVQALLEALEFAFIKPQKMVEFAENLYPILARDYSRDLIHEKIFEAYFNSLEAVNSLD